jgi:peptidoglycan lytic transglycosylase G
LSRKLLAFALGLVLAGAGTVLLLNESYRGFEDQTFVQVEHGTGTLAIGRSLEQAGVIRYAWQFWIERALRPGAKLQAGEYRFHQPASVREVFDRIARGDIYYVEFIVPEGSNMFDIGHAIETAGVMPAEDFLRAAGDPALVRDLAPEAKTLEGFLFPATYRLTHSTTAADLCRQMTDQFRKQWKKLATDRNADPLQTITLASLVEKETGVASERALVAGVFTNRLKKAMRLECDPTTIYAALLDNRYRDVIHQSDLASQNPYNTYQHAGLPPGPIANPGAAAIAAALDPAQTDFLYFVARPKGAGHQFSATLAAHEKATREYRNGSGNGARKTRKAG